MKMTLSYVAARGDVENERLIFVVADDGDVGEYLAIRTRYAGDLLTTDIQQTFWFPDSTVKRGDRVVLYSKTGTQKISDRKDGGKTHFFYWGLTEPQWKSEEFGVVLIHSVSWAAKRSDEISDTPQVKLAAS